MAALPGASVESHEARRALLPAAKPQDRADNSGTRNDTVKSDTV